MMRYLTVEEVLALHSRVIAVSGGSLGLRDHNALHSAGMARDEFASWLERRVDERP